MKVYVYLFFVFLATALVACSEDDTQSNLDKGTDSTGGDTDSEKSSDSDVNPLACHDPAPEASHDPAERRMILRDEGNAMLHYVDLADPENNWHVEIPNGRDIQPVGDNRVLIGTENGFQIHDIATGDKVDEVTNHSGTITARRLRNGNTLLLGTNWQHGLGATLLEVDSEGEELKSIGFPDYSYVRLARETLQGTYLITANSVVFEADEDGEILWEATIQNSTQPHAWQAVRLATGEVAVSTGFAKSMQIFSVDGEIVETLKRPLNATPNFFAGFQIMNNGNYVITNWQGHGEGNGEKGIQLIEQDPEGELVWSWKQDASFVSSLQGVLVLNDLDLDKLHVEGCTGALVPVE